jgi:hypothetical protein
MAYGPEEIQQWQQLMEEIEDADLAGEQDRDLEPSGQFSTHSMYLALPGPVVVITQDI